MRKIQAVEVTWLDARETVTELELSRSSGLTLAELGELIEYGALTPLASGASGEKVFSAACIAPLRRAGRLRRDFDLEVFALVILLGYLERIEELEKELHSLRAHVPGHAHADHREGPHPWREPHG